MILKKSVFETNKQFIPGKNYGKYKKTKRLQACETGKRKRYIVSEPSYDCHQKPSKFQSSKWFSENILEIQKKRQK